MKPVLRWGFRLFKRDWRQQVLVIGLLTFAVAAALFLSVAVSNAVDSPVGEFGRANMLIRQHVSDGPRAAANLDAVRQQFGGVIEVIGHRRSRSPVLRMRSTSAPSSPAACSERRCCDSSTAATPQLRARSR